MTPLYLLDTNIVSYFLKAQFPAVRRNIERTALRSLAISVITQAEVLYGLERISASPLQRVTAENFFAKVTVLDWNPAAARAYAKLRTAQERKGRPLSTEDMLIAAQALAEDLTLVTHDQAFSFIDVLRTEDWTIT
jgi:tRNA(fMet)-specific endonuclease VapC